MERAELKVCVIVHVESHLPMKRAEFEGRCGCPVVSNTIIRLLIRVSFIADRSVRPLLVMLFITTCTSL